MTKLLDKVKLVVAMCADPRLSHAHKIVGIVEALKFHNTTTGQCNPSRPLVGKASCTAESTVSEANAALAKLGYMEIDQSSGGRNKRNAYRFNFETVVSDDGIDDRNGRQRRHKPSSTATETVVNDDAHITRERTQEENTGSAPNGASPQKEWDGKYIYDPPTQSDLDLKRQKLERLVAALESESASPGRPKTLIARQLEKARAALHQLGDAE